MRLSSLILLTGLFVLQWTAVAYAQAPFEAPPVPAAAETVASAVQGAVNTNMPAATAHAPAGVDAAPAATFVAPAGSMPAAHAHLTEIGRSAEPLADAKLIEGGEIIARVGDQVVLASDVMWQVNRLIETKLAEAGRTAADLPEGELAAAQKAVMRMMVLQLIDTKLIFAEFRRTVPPENMPKIEESLAGPFEEVEVPRLIKIFDVHDRLQLEEALKKNGITLKDVQRQFIEKTIAGEWLRQQMPKPKPITHEEMLAYYQDHLKEYEFPAKARWEELMVRFDRAGGDRDSAWKQLADMGNEVWKKVDENPGIRGPAFAEVARAKSHGFTASEGGLHEWTTLGALKCEELNKALATLAIGQMSNGIESEQGFHIVRVLERTDAGRTPFTEAQAEIIKLLEEEQMEVLRQEQLEKIRRNARVWTIFDGDLAGARLSDALGGKKKG